MSPLVPTCLLPAAPTVLPLVSTSPLVLMDPLQGMVEDLPPAVLTALHLVRLLHLHLTDLLLVTGDSLHRVRTAHPRESVVSRRPVPMVPHQATVTGPPVRMALLPDTIRFGPPAPMSHLPGSVPPALTALRRVSTHSSASRRVLKDPRLVRLLPLLLKARLLVTTLSLCRQAPRGLLLVTCLCRSRATSEPRMRTARTLRTNERPARSRARMFITLSPPRA